MLYVQELLFDDWNEDHIARPSVIPEEVEEVCQGDLFVSRTWERRLRVIGQTEAGRYLTVILAPRGRGVYYPIAARDATAAERRLYHRQKGRGR